VVAGLSLGLSNPENVGSSKTSQSSNNTPKVFPKAPISPSFFTLGHHNGVEEPKKRPPTKNVKKQPHLKPQNKLPRVPKIIRKSSCLGLASFLALWVTTCSLFVVSWWPEGFRSILKTSFCTIPPHISSTSGQGLVPVTAQCPEFVQDSGAAVHRLACSIYIYIYIYCTLVPGFVFLVS